MTYKICILPFILLQTACGVELRDKPSEPTVQVASKPDFIIDGPLTLESHTQIEEDRVVLTKNAVITTGDKNLVILAKEIVSEGAIIQNFPAGTVAFWERNGRTGGTISIETVSARGTLDVKLNAEGGGHGKNGAITIPGRHPGCAGTNGGTGGNAGSLRFVTADNANFNLNWSNEVGAPGPAGGRGVIPNGQWRSDSVVMPPCPNDARDGVVGQPGGKGQVCVKLGSETLRCLE